MLIGPFRASLSFAHALRKLRAPSCGPGPQLCRRDLRCRGGETPQVGRQAKKTSCQGFRRIDARRHAPCIWLSPVCACPLPVLSLCVPLTCQGGRDCRDLWRHEHAAGFSPDGTACLQGYHLQGLLAQWEVRAWMMDGEADGDPTGGAAMPFA